MGWFESLDDFTIGQKNREPFGFLGSFLLEDA